MTDIFDQATDKEMRDRDLAIQHARSNNQPIKYTGHCLYCNEALERGRFCPQEDCGERWEFEQKMKKQNGRR